MKRKPTVRVGAFWKSSKGRYFLKIRVRNSEWTEQTDIDTRSTRSKSKADKQAERRKQELLAKFNQSDWTWDDFEERYKKSHLKFTSRDNQHKWNAVSKFVELAAKENREIGGLLHLSDIKPRFLTDVETLLRSELSAGSIDSYMGTLRGGLNWAASEEMMPPLPRRRKPPGRVDEDLPAYRLIPIDEQSLERMFDVTDTVVGKRHAESVKRYLRALWLSGCRMREPLSIHAFKRDCHRPIELEGSEPKFFWTTNQKNRRAGRHRITLDFAADVRARIDCGGYLYRPTCETGEILSRTALGNVVSAIGEKAEVYAEEGKTATAKHFRSSFCQRWSSRGMPVKLIQEICRHRSESTTRKYYIGDADDPKPFSERHFFGDQIGDQETVS